jgi:hypothetical protein
MSHNTESAPIAAGGPWSSVGEHPNAVTNRYERKIKLICFYGKLFLFSFYTYERVQEIVEFIQKKVSIKPEVGIICGSGLGGLAELIVDKIVIPYVDIPHFPKSTG